MIITIHYDHCQVDGGDHGDDIDPDDEQGDDEVVEGDACSLQGSFSTCLLQVSLFLQNEHDQEGLGMAIVITRLMAMKMQMMISLDGIKFR